MSTGFARELSPCDALMIMVSGIVGSWMALTVAAIMAASVPVYFFWKRYRP